MVTVELAWWQADAIDLTNAGDKPEEEVMLSMNLWARSSRIMMMIRTKILALVCSAAGLPPFLALEGGSRSEQSIPSILVSAGSAFDAHCQLHEEWHGSGSLLVEKRVLLGWDWVQGTWRISYWRFLEGRSNVYSKKISPI